ncbi:hypothetical protein JOC37_000071 [Desulfohalotomaculum tongense]|uniref:stalk domain-containing protein n=1 Tax=Desulforadius tongensis TaxID=1216062 RepID=UPI00195D0829|nr:hypothetical protein [Desulforadius tongensis]
MEADTKYSSVGISTVKDGQFVKMGRIVITGTTTLTFSGENDRAEFRLPPDCYITSAGLYGSADDDCGVVFRVVRGLDDPSAVTIHPISEDPYNPGYYNGFEIIVNSKSGADGEKPELILYFNNVYVVPGYTGDVYVTIERGDYSGFSDGKAKIAKVAEGELKVSAEKVPYIVVDKRIGPIVVSENMSRAFDYIEFSLPSGFEWEDSAVIDPGLGLVRDYDGDGVEERDYKVSIYKNKYGRSVLKVELIGEKSTHRGTLRIECDVDVDEDIASYGDVKVQISGSSDPDKDTLKVADYNEQKVSVSAGSPKHLSPGLVDQEIAEITIKENAPGALIDGGRYVDLVLPSWAQWAEEPYVEIEGTTELELGLSAGKAIITDDDRRVARFYIEKESKSKPAKVIIKKPKVSVDMTAQGDLKIIVGGRAGASGELTVGTVSVPFTAVSLSKPELTLGQQGQQAGDIEIKETAGQALLARELWLEFPDHVSLCETPSVNVTSGDLVIGEPEVVELGEKQRLVIPINVSSYSASTIKISNIKYDIDNAAPDGDVKVKIGGPAVKEMNNSGTEWAAGTANAVVAVNLEIKKNIPDTRVVVFQLGKNFYYVNNKIYKMDSSLRVDQGRTFLPLRYAGLALGADSDISWDKKSQTAKLYKNNTEIKVKLGENAVYAAGKKIETGAAAHVYNGRVMVPLRAVAQAFGAEVEWRSDTKTVIIITEGEN